MVDEAGANFNAIQAVFGKEMLAHTVTCQWHFKACAKCQLPSIMPEDQNTFIEMIGKLYKTYVRSEYIRVVAVLVETCGRTRNSTLWLLSGAFYILGLNLVEVGHAMLKTSCKMKLLMATHRDICHFMVQDREYTGFQTNSTHLRGRGPTLLETKRKRKRAEEIFIQQCKENIAQGNKEQDIPNDQEEIFVPNKRARHRVPKTFFLANLTQQKSKINPMFRKQQIINQDNRIKRRIQIKEQRRKVSRNQSNRMPIVKKKMVILNKMSRVPHSKEEEKLNSNPLEIVFINGNITKC